MWPGIPDTYKKLPESDSGSFRYTRSRDYQTPTRHALLGHRKWTYCLSIEMNIKLLCSFLQFLNHFTRNVTAKVAAAAIVIVGHMHDSSQIHWHFQFLANVNSRSRSLYAVARPSVCRLSVCRL